MEPNTFRQLSRVERSKLTCFKWTYAMETAGFTRTEARRLIFLMYRLASIHKKRDDMRNRIGDCEVYIW